MLKEDLWPSLNIAGGGWLKGEQLGERICTPKSRSGKYVAKIEVEVNKVGYGKYLHKVSTYDRSYLERVLGK